MSVTTVGNSSEDCKTGLRLPTLLSGGKVSRSVHAVGDGVTGAAQKVSGGVSGAVHVVGSGVSGAAQKAGGTVSGASQSAKGGVSKAAQKIGGGVSRTFGAMRGKTVTEQSSPVDASVHCWPSLFDTIAKPWTNCCCNAIVSHDAEKIAEGDSVPNNILGALVHKMIASFDACTLGVDVKCGSMRLDASDGRIEVSDLLVGNPEGYHSAYLLSVGKAAVHVNMKKLLVSRGTDVDVDELLVDDVDVIYEKSISSSNLKDLLNSLASSEDESTSDGQVDYTLTLHRVRARNVGAKLASVLTRGAGARVEVGDINCTDFDQDNGRLRRYAGVVRMLLTTLVKSVLATIFGKNATKAVMGVVGDAQQGYKKALSQGVGVAKRASDSALRLPRDA